MKFLVLVPVYGRYDILKLFAEGLNVLKDQGYDIEVLAVGSSTEDMLVCRELDFMYVNHRNILGEKLNAALKEAKKIDFDAMLMLGSDDILNAETLDFYQFAFSKEYRFVGFLDCYFFNMDTKGLIKWNGYRGEREGEPIGAWRCFKRDLIEDLNWELWGNQHHSIDYTMWQKIKSCRGILKTKLREGMFICDLKTKANVTKFQKFPNSVIVNHKEEFKKIDNNFKQKILNYGK